MTKNEFLVKLKQKNKITENDLKLLSLEYQKSFFLIFDNCPYSIFLIDKKGVIGNLNSASAKLLKRDKEEIKGKSFKGLLKRNTRGSFEKRFNLFMKNNHKKIEFNLVLKDKNGTDVPCLASVVKDNSKNNNNFILFAHDITKEDKNASLESELLTALLDNIPDHIYFKDKESRFIRVNKAKASKDGKK
jgi:PAS domain S-box-containing protein